MLLSEKLKILRNEKKKTQQQASDEMKISISSLRNYENGKIPDTTQLNIIKNYYDVPYEYLLDNNCENKTKKSVEIGKELNLSDSSLNIIRNIKETKTLNMFFEYFNFKQLIKNIDLYHKINKIINHDLKLILYICDIWEYILDRVKNKKQDDLKEFFNKCNVAVNNTINFTVDTQFFDPSDSKFDLFKESYENLKNSIFNKNINSKILDDIKYELETLLDLLDEINKKYIMYSKIIKLNINDIINNFLFRIEKEYNITFGSEQYTKMFGKYIENLNSDIKNDYKYSSTIYKRQNK